MMEKRKNPTLVLPYIVLMTFAFTVRYGDFTVSYYIQIIIGLVWILLTLLQLALNSFRFTGKNAIDYKRFLKLYLIPHIIIHIYTVLLMLFGKIKWDYFTTNLTVYVPTLIAVFSVYLFDARAFKYTCYAMICSWLLSVLSSFILKGFAIFPHAILQAYVNPYDSTGGLTVNYLELHDLVLSIGYVLVYYIFSKSKMSNKNWFVMIIILLIMGLGMKKASLIGLILTILFNEIVKQFKKEKKYKICNWAGWFGFIACYMFIYILSSGANFYELIEYLGINTMGRKYYYQAIMNYAEFKPSFLGIGRNVVTQILNTDLSYLKVGGVHSDIIKMYVENGFVMFGLWLCYYLIYIPKIYKKKYGYDAAILCFGMTIYTFALYLTDNIEIYYICQIISIVIPMTYVLDKKEIQSNAGSY